MPPVVDVQTLRPVAGDEWRWADARPEEGLTASGLLSASSNLLVVEDRDESWRASTVLFDLGLSAAWRKGSWSSIIELPLRGEWEGQVNVADPRVSVLHHRGKMTLRGGFILPLGGMDWPYTWDDWRVDGGASLSLQNLSGSLGGSYGESGTLLRGSLGGKYRDASLEVSYMRGGEGGFLQSGEVTLSYALRSERVSASPFLSAGFLATPGTPSLRAGILIGERTPKKPAPVPVIVEPLPPPEPLEELPPPPPKKISRVRIDQHPACAPRKDEDRIIREMTERAGEYMKRFSYPDLFIETELLSCEVERSVVVRVLQLR